MEYAYSNYIYYCLKLILFILTFGFIDSFKSMVCNWVNIKCSILVGEHSKIAFEENMLFFEWIFLSKQFNVI